MVPVLPTSRGSRAVLGVGWMPLFGSAMHLPVSSAGLEQKAMNLTLQGVRVQHRPLVPETLNAVTIARTLQIPAHKK
jgi:hypothetical protein